LDTAFVANLRTKVRSDPQHGRLEPEIFSLGVCFGKSIKFVVHLQAILTKEANK